MEFFPLGFVVNREYIKLQSYLSLSPQLRWIESTTVDRFGGQKQIVPSIVFAKLKNKSNAVFCVQMLLKLKIYIM